MRIQNGETAQALRISDLDLARTNHDSPAELLTFLLQAGVPLSGIDAYAAKVRLTGTSSGESVERAAEDLIWLLRHAAGLDSYRVLAALPVGTFIGYAIADPTDLPHISRISDTAGDWGYRPIGWLAAAAGLTPAEYDAASPAPDVDTLLALAALRLHASGLSDLAKDLR